MPSWSPYAYAFDNPVRFIDPTGMKPDDWYENNITKERYWKDGSGEIAGYINKGSSFQDGSLTYAADGYIYDDSASGGGKAIENGRLHGIEEVTIWSAGAIAQKNRQEARSRLPAAQSLTLSKFYRLILHKTISLIKAQT